MLPPITGTIDRRLLLNYRVDPDVLARQLPSPFRPQLVDGAAVAGICLIRLVDLRPRGLPRRVGRRSENAAHRMAVEWDTPDGPRTGVYIPRRDSDSMLNTLLGGRLFPGDQHRARFDVHETATDVRVAFESTDGSTQVAVDATVTDRLDGSSLFADLQQASRFFEAGAHGFSATRERARFDGMQLQTTAWKVEAAFVNSARSSLYDDPARFPPGTAQLDGALLMRGVPVVWKQLASLHAS